MRLIHCATLELREFNECDVPEYAILSHTWGNEEVSFEEMTRPTPATYNKAGYRKIQNFVFEAAPYCFEYIWVDTCCIKKESSSELSEAINSMYTWYKNAARCYVYLEDVEHFTAEDFRKCRWSSRGWTLQELIAPADVRFYCKHWDFMFTKEECVFVLSETLGIRPEILLTCDPSLASAAERMSWAARRVTTRPEDMAYCLLGIFDVNMPMLYGEGGIKAFIRLQGEIMKISDDQSLFAWRKEEVEGESLYSSYTGLLAPSPMEFLDSHNIAFMENPLENCPYSSTNKGISIRLNLIPYRADRHEPEVYIALLDCRYHGPEGRPIGIYLKRLEGDQFARIDPHRLFSASDARSNGQPTPMDVYVRQSIRLPRGHLTPRVYGFVLADQISVPGVYLADMWPVDCLRLLPSEQSKIAALCYRSRVDPTFGTIAVLLRWDKESLRFSSFCTKDPTWTEGTSIQERVETMAHLIRGNDAEVWFYTAGLQRKAKVDMELGMRGDKVVIKVTVKIGEDK
ncbi:hypothetical protein PG993_000575 [Apiospora rasikravindrae]|uniref:Heterokaryon incompatibility domain-containing protein n=1 Tax=Apiospora rasikravindrae TaxID=990691 RepID=A0ABR1U8Y2_9PEZI